MILVDTSVWIYHLRQGEPGLSERLLAGDILCHPFVIGELALGHLRQHSLVLRFLAKVPTAVRASDTEVVEFVRSHRLAGCGIGYVDAALLASTLLTPEAMIWARDRRLSEAAIRLGVAWRP